MEQLSKAQAEEAVFKLRDAVVKAEMSFTQQYGIEHKPQLVVYIHDEFMWKIRAGLYGELHQVAFEVHQEGTIHGHALVRVLPMNVAQPDFIVVTLNKPREEATRFGYVESNKTVRRVPTPRL
jgi:hypothetical protein